MFSYLILPNYEAVKLTEFIGNKAKFVDFLQIIKFLTNLISYTSVSIFRNLHSYFKRERNAEEKRRIVFHAILYNY